METVRDSQSAHIGIILSKFWKQFSYVCGAHVGSLFIMEPNFDHDFWKKHFRSLYDGNIKILIWREKSIKKSLEAQNVSSKTIREDCYDFHQKLYCIFKYDIAHVVEEHFHQVVDYRLKIILFSLDLASYHKSSKIFDLYANRLLNSPFAMDDFNETSLIVRNAFVRFPEMIPEYLDTLFGKYYFGHVLLEIVGLFGDQIPREVFLNIIDSGALFLIDRVRKFFKLITHSVDYIMVIITRYEMTRRTIYLTNTSSRLELR